MICQEPGRVGQQHKPLESIMRAPLQAKASYLILTTHSSQEEDHLLEIQLQRVASVQDSREIVAALEEEQAVGLPDTAPKIKTIRHKAEAL